MIGNFIVLDLEWNCRHISNGFFNEIIEFGAVKLDENADVCDCFRAFVKPSGGKLSSTVKRITHITAEDLENAAPFKTVYTDFVKWAGVTDVLLCYGNCDILVMLENLRYHGYEEKISFAENYADMQYYCQVMLKQNTAQMLSLTDMAQLAGIQTDDKSMHRALDDCRVSAEVFKSQYNESELAPYVYKNNRQLYERLSFKPAVISDIDNSLVTRGSMRICCPQCGTLLKRTGAWQFKNKYFRAPMECGVCKNGYTGKIRVRIEYDGVTVKSTATPEHTAQ